MPIADYVCEHGVRFGDPVFQDGQAWNGPVSRCECCGHNIYYIDSFNHTAKGSSGRIWTPKNKCGECGGGYTDF